MSCKTHYIATPCCGGDDILFCAQDASLNGVYLYTGPGYAGYGGQLVTDSCYTFTLVDGFGNYPFLSAEVAADLVPTSQCDPEVHTDGCFPCPKKLVFRPCCNRDITINFLDDALYPPGAGSNISYQYTGGTLYFDNEAQALIPNGCYTIHRETATPAELAVLVTPPSHLNFLMAGKYCGDESQLPPGDQCLNACTYYYQLTNCADDKETYCTTSNLSTYINNLIENDALWPVIQVNEYPDKCFYVEQVASCTGPVPVTVSSDYIGCADCQATIVTYYELINCNNPQVIVYTSTDLHEYVGSYITLEEYGKDCFYVSVATGLVPSDVPVTYKNTFETCEACTLPRYILEDCLGVADSIITQTDLSSYVGSVITLETCPDICWSVSETDITTPSSDVFINQSFQDCPTCIAILPTYCVSFYNSTTNSLDVDFISVTGESAKITIQAGQTSTKTCYLQWTPVTGIIVKVYGDCVNGVCPPEPPKPKRKVTPGYNTPACTAEYYEKVECTFSEWMYKDVLEKRYGISNCCPADLMRWEIKHEMLMLDALINPDYTCVPPVNCGCAQPTTCNCSCNSGN